MNEGQSCACFLWSYFSENPSWWRKGIHVIRLCDSTPITLFDRKSFSFAMSNFSYMVLLQLSSFASPVCSSSQCSLEIYVILKEADSVRHLSSVGFVIHKSLVTLTFATFALWFFPIFLFCTYAIIIIQVEWFLLHSKVRRESYVLW